MGGQSRRGLGGFSRYGELVQLNVSGANLGNRFVHGTDIESAVAVLKTGQLLMGKSTPHGIYGFSEAQMLATPKLQDKSKFYNHGAQVIFEGHGTQVVIDGVHKGFVADIVPENMIGILRKRQVVANPLGVQAMEVRFDAERLCGHLSKALECSADGQAAYHEVVLKLMEEHDKKSDDAVRAVRAKRRQQEQRSSDSKRR